MVDDDDDVEYPSIFCLIAMFVLLANGRGMPTRGKGEDPMTATDSAKGWLTDLRIRWTAEEERSGKENIVLPANRWEQQDGICRCNYFHFRRINRE